MASLKIGIARNPCSDTLAIKPGPSQRKGRTNALTPQQRQPAQTHTHLPGAHHEKKTLGSLFAGIGGFDLGFEQAGWHTAWQVEINPVNRSLLAHRFPHARQFIDVRECGAQNLPRVDCITAGFPCQDISTAGNAKRDRSTHGLKGSRSGLFFEAVRIFREIQPTWVVLENVEGLLHSNDSADLEAVVHELADCGYLGFWRVLDAQHFGLPQRRRRVFLVAGLGRFPALEFLVDAAPVEAIPSALSALESARPADAWPGYTLCAITGNGQLQMGGEIFVAHADGWDQMLERARVSESGGVRRRLDVANLAMRYAAGNAVCPPVARWIADILQRS